SAVALGIALLGGHNRVAEQQRRSLAHLVEEGGPGPLTRVGGALDVAERASALDGVPASGYPLAIEVGQLLDQAGSLHQVGAGGAAAAAGAAGIGRRQRRSDLPVGSVALAASVAHGRFSTITAGIVSLLRCIDVPPLDRLVTGLGDLEEEPCAA